MSALYINAVGGYVEPIDDAVPATDLKALVAEAVGSPVRRIGRFIQLALIGAGRCAKAATLPGDAAVYLGSGRGDLEVTIEVMQSLLRDGHAPKPLSFINTVSNAACYYVAQSLKVMGRSTFVCNRYFAFESMLQLASLDLNSGFVKTALVGTVDVVVPPLSAHRIRLGLGIETSVADATHWLWLQTTPTAQTLGRLIAAEPFADRETARAWLQNTQLPKNCLFASGQFMSDEESDVWCRELDMKAFDYRQHRGYYDSQSGAAIGEFFAHSEGRALLHLNRDPSGRYSAMLIERGS